VDSPFSSNQIQGCFWGAVLGVRNGWFLSDAAALERIAPLIITGLTRRLAGSTTGCSEGVLWIVRTVSPWRDLPEAFVDWTSVFRRFTVGGASRVFGGGFFEVDVPMIRTSNS